MIKLTLKEELEKNQISSNYFNLLSKKSHYSGMPFKNHNLYIKHITRNLKEKYPTLSDSSCIAIGNCGLVGRGYQLSDIIILDQSIFSFINHKENDNPDFCYGSCVHHDSCSYRNIDSMYFLYNLDKHTNYQVNQDGNIQIINPNDTGLNSKEELEYTHFLADSLTTFLKEQGYELKVKPKDQQRSNQEIYSNGHLKLDWKNPCISYNLFVDCNYVTLAKSYAKKEDAKMNLAFFKGKNLEMTASLNQHFDQNQKCMIHFDLLKKKYFSLNEGWQEVKVKRSSPVKININQVESSEQTKFLSDSTMKKKDSFPYHSILIDQELKDDFIKIMPQITTIPIISVPNFQDHYQCIEYFYQKIIDKNKDHKRSLLISKNQGNIICCHELKIDTCFINIGSNDMIDYKTTYEVASMEQIPKMKIKSSTSITSK